MGLDDDSSGAVAEAAAELVSGNTALLANAVSSLPQLLEKKRHINMHMNIASAVLEEVKLRKLDQLFETEASCFFTLCVRWNTNRPENRLKQSNYAFIKFN